MPSPVLPDDVKAILPSPNSNLCQKILAWFKGLDLLYKLVAYMFKSDGTITDQFKTDIGIATGTLTAPVNVQASDGTFTDKVRITWDPVGTATFYEVWRSLTNDNSAASKLTTVFTPTVTFDDSTAAANTTYWYFIKAGNPTATSGFSLGDSGFSDTSGGGGGGSTGTRILAPGDTWLVPAGVTDVQAEIWGGSGGGGGSNCDWCVAGSAFYSGGGGGSGEYLKVKTIPVTAGWTLTFAGGGGGAGASSGGSGAAGQDSVLRHNSDNLATAAGGSGGHLGNLTQNGAGGAGGTGGSAAVGSIDTQTAGNAGTGGTSAFPVPAGGAGGAAVASGPGPGGNGGSNSGGLTGANGRIKLTWPSP